MLLAPPSGKKPIWLTPAMAALSCCVLSAGPLAAQPSIWECARDPRLLAAYRLLVRAERKLVLSGDPEHPAESLMGRRIVRAMLAVEEQALPEPRLRFILGDLVARPPEEDFAESQRLLEQALGEAPESALAAAAWYELGIAYAKLGEPRKEYRAYTEALERAWDSDERAQLYSNRGDTCMVLGELGAAVADYRRAIELAQDPAISTLAYYGLGVALDRKGDLPAALAAMSTGTNIWPASFLTSALDLPNVFFVPPYDIFYFRALIAMAAAEAEATRSPADAAYRERALQRASEYWQQYLREAEPAGEPWVRNARSHLASCQQSLRDSRRGRHPNPASQDRTTPLMGGGAPQRSSRIQIAPNGHRLATQAQASVR